MPRNGSGTYSLPAGNPVTTGTTISSTVQNNTTSDIASALTDSIAASGVTTPTANLPMGGFHHTGAGNATALTSYTTATDVQKGTPSYLTSVGGTANAITATAPYSMAAYTAGQVFRFIVASTNTSTVTLQINGITGAKAITKAGAIPLSEGDLVANALVEVSYDGTQFQLIGANKVGTNATGEAYYDHGDSGTTAQALNLQLGAHHRIKATGNFTLTTSNWPASGTTGELLLELVGDGTARTITYNLGGTTTNFIKADGTFAATPAAAGVTMQSASNAIDFIGMWSRDGGTTVYAKVLR